MSVLFLKSLNKKQAVVSTALISLFFLILTIIATVIVHRNVQTGLDVSFENEVQKLHFEVAERLNRYEDALYGLRGFFHASNEVSLQEWDGYVNSINIFRRVPGIRSLILIDRVARSRKESYIQTTQQSFDALGEEVAFSVFPESSFDEMFVTRRVNAWPEPSSAVGLDVRADAVRSEAALRARDSGLTSITAPFTLVTRDAETGLQPSGLIMFLPIFQSKTIPSTVVARKNDLEGFVGAVLRLSSFFESVFSSSGVPAGMGLRVADKELLESPEGSDYFINIAVDSTGEIQVTETEDLQYIENPIIKELSFGGRTWVFRYLKMPWYTKTLPQNQVHWWVFAIGLLATGVVGVFSWYMLMQRVRVMKTAQELSEDVDNLSEHLKLATHAAHIGVWEWDVSSDQLIWDTTMFELYGLDPQQHTQTMYALWHDTVHPKDIKRVEKRIEDALSGMSDFNIVFRIVWPDQTIRYISAQGVVERNISGEAERMIGINRDVTRERLAAENETKRVEQLERLNNLMVDRELRMRNMKQEIEELRSQQETHKK